MIRHVFLWASLVLAGSQGSQDEELIKMLPSSKHTLLQGIEQVSKGSETAISAKFELEKGKLSLSVYTAAKGLGVAAEHNVLQEYGGSPEADAWKPELEVFKDVEHVARSAEQLTLMSLAKSSLADIVRKAQKDQAGTVYSITPVLRGRKAQFEVLVADKGKRVELCYDVMTGDAVKPMDAGYKK